MHKNKRARLEAHGWRFGDAADFLALTPLSALSSTTCLRGDTGSDPCLRSVSTIPMAPELGRELGSLTRPDASE